MANRKLDPTQKRTERVHICLTREERDELERVCIERNMSISEAVRRALALLKCTA